MRDNRSFLFLIAWTFIFLFLDEAESFGIFYVNEKRFSGNGLLAYSKSHVKHVRSDVWSISFCSDSILFFPKKYKIMVRYCIDNWRFPFQGMFTFVIFFSAFWLISGMGWNQPYEQLGDQSNLKNLGRLNPRMPAELIQVKRQKQENAAMCGMLVQCLRVQEVQTLQSGGSWFIILRQN